MGLRIAIPLLLLLASIAGLAWIRLAPSDPAAWHADPLTAADPGSKGVLLRPGPDAPTYPVPPQELLAAFDRVALAQPRTRRLAGSVPEGHVTYVTRTPLIGFPDYVSARAVPAAGGAQLAVLSRQRFGGGDLGQNARRLEDWLQRLQAVLG